MKNLILNTALLIIIILVNNSTVNAQNADEMMFGASRKVEAKKVATGAFGEMVAEEKSDVFMADVAEASSPEFVRKPKMLTDDFSGYAIELVTVFNKPLDLTDELFQQFGGLKIERRTANSYTYVLTNFADKDAVTEYLNKMVLPRYTNAKAIKYKKGEQIKF